MQSDAFPREHPTAPRQVPASAVVAPRAVRSSPPCKPINPERCTARLSATDKSVEPGSAVRTRTPVEAPTQHAPHRNPNPTTPCSPTFARQRRERRTSLWESLTERAIELFGRAEARAARADVAACNAIFHATTQPSTTQDPVRGESSSSPPDRIFQAPQWSVGGVP